MLVSLNGIELCTNQTYLVEGELSIISLQYIQGLELLMWNFTCSLVTQISQERLSF